MGFDTKGLAEEIMDFYAYMLEESHPGKTICPGCFALTAEAKTCTVCGGTGLIDKEDNHGTPS
jgi:rRNA maturation endonuclease Nob1